MNKRTPYAGSAMKPLDRIDMKILQALQTNGRLTNQELAARVALSPSACLARVRQLEAAGFISGYHAHINVELVRSTLVVLAELSLKRHSAAEFARFEALLRSIPEVVEAVQVSGDFDYLAKVVVADVREWRELAARLQEGEHGVEKVISHIVLKDSKQFSGFPIGLP